MLGGDRISTVVGVVGDVRDRGLDVPSSGHVYFSSWQSPQRRMILLVRPGGAELELVSPVRAAVAEVESRMPVYDVRPVTSVISDSLASPRLSLLLMGAFAGTALLLAAIGVYGVLSYTVALRTREIGTRIAMGATPSGVVGLILRQVTFLWLVGGVIGGAVALGARTVVQGLLFDVNAGNPVILGAAIMGLGVVAVAAGFVPARRASRVDCAEALRQE
jgi:predicted lysophospholipase L1 biosynthesis ABC-type transport system permease subunit